MIHGLIHALSPPYAFQTGAGKPQADTASSSLENAASQAPKGVWCGVYEKSIQRCAGAGGIIGQCLIPSYSLVAAELIEVLMAAITCTGDHVNT